MAAVAPPAAMPGAAQEPAVQKDLTEKVDYIKNREMQLSSLGRLLEQKFERTESEFKKRIAAGKGVKAKGIDFGPEILQAALDRYHAKPKTVHPQQSQHLQQSFQDRSILEPKPGVAPDAGATRSHAQAFGDIKQQQVPPQRVSPAKKPRCASSEPLSGAGPPAARTAPGIFKEFPREKRDENVDPQTQPRFSPSLRDRLQSRSVPTPQVREAHETRAQATAAKTMRMIDEFKPRPVSNLQGGVEEFRQAAAGALGAAEAAASAWRSQMQQRPHAAVPEALRMQQEAMKATASKSFSSSSPPTSAATTRKETATPAASGFRASVTGAAATDLKSAVKAARAAAASAAALRKPAEKRPAAAGVAGEPDDDSDSSSSESSTSASTQDQRPGAKPASATAEPKANGQRQPGAHASPPKTDKSPPPSGAPQASADARTSPPKTEKPKAATGTPPTTAKEIKAVLLDHNVDVSGCLDKADFEALWRRWANGEDVTASKGPAAPGPAAAGGAASSGPAASAPPARPAPAPAAPAKPMQPSATTEPNTPEAEVRRVLGVLKGGNDQVWAFRVMDCERPLPRWPAQKREECLASVQKQYRTLMKKLHPDKVNDIAGSDKAIEAIRKAKEICERALSRQQAPGEPTNLRCTVLCAERGRRRIRLQWSAPQVTDSRPLQRYIVQALDPAFGKFLTVATLEPDYSEELRRYISMEELGQYDLVEQDLLKMPKLFQQAHAQLQVSAANEAGQSPWAPVKVPISAPAGTVTQTQAPGAAKKKQKTAPFF